MDRWMPLPTGLILDAVRGWSRETPAPKLIAWAAIWEGGKHASISSLAKDLGWSRSALYRLRSEVDAFRAEWQGVHPGTLVETTAGRGVVDIQPLIEQNRTDLGQNRTDLGRLTRARSLLATDIHTEQTIDRETQQAAKPALKVAEAWKALNAEYLQHRAGGRALTLTKARRRQLKQRLNDYTADELVAALRWMMTSRHPRAVFLQEGGYSVDTLLKASNAPQYVELSKAPAFSSADQRVARYEARQKARDAGPF